MHKNKFSTLIIKIPGTSFMHAVVFHHSEENTDRGPLLLYGFFLLNHCQMKSKLITKINCNQILINELTF